MKLAAIFLIAFAICGANCGPRPAWYHGVNHRFKAATNMIFPYTNYAQTYLPAHLAHVVSWADIQTIIDTWDAAGQQAGWDLRPFVMYLTEVDTHACVFDPLNPIPCTLHTTILNNNNGALMNLNTAIRNDVINEINNGNPQGTSYIKRLLNSAPANLRYGTPGFNTKIINWVDPMGDVNHLLTMKEMSMFYATDARCIRYNAFNFITPPFVPYPNYFQNVIGGNVNNIHLEGTYYTSTPTQRTALNQQFEPTNAADTNDLYVLSSSQAGAVQLGWLPGDQNNRDTIRYQVANI